MIVALFAVMAAGQGSLFQQVVPNPTGSNGYEDYVRAADIVKSDAFQAFEDWQPKGSLEAKRDSKSEEYAKTAAEIRDLSYLALRQEEIKRFGTALNLVRKGNAKPVQDPRSTLAPDTSFPELPIFKRLAQLFVVEAYVRLCDGQSMAGARSFADAVEFGERIGDGGFLASVTGDECRAIAFEGISDRLGLLSEPACDELRRLSDDLLKQPVRLAKAVDRESARAAVMVDRVLAHPGELPKSLIAGESREFSDAVKAIEEASNDQKLQLREQFLSIAGKLFVRLRARLQRPERDWAMADQDRFALYSKNKTPLPSDLMLTAFTGFDDAYFEAAVDRTRLRLLELNMRILHHRWERTTLPATLAEIATPDLIFDPMSGAPFVYESRQSGYGLFSKTESWVIELGKVHKMP